MYDDSATGVYQSLLILPHVDVGYLSRLILPDHAARADDDSPHRLCHMQR
jgi:hypothetical protein